MFIDVYCHIIDKMTLAAEIKKKYLMLFNRGIDTLPLWHLQTFLKQCHHSMNESTNQSIEFIEWKTKCFMID
jgi:hypothetical protein